MFFSLASASGISITSASWFPSPSTNRALKDPVSVDVGAVTSCCVCVRSRASLLWRFDGGGITVAMAAVSWLFGAGCCLIVGFCSKFPVLHAQRFMVPAAEVGRFCSRCQLQKQMLDKWGRHSIPGELADPRSVMKAASRAFSQQAWVIIELHLLKTSKTAPTTSAEVPDFKNVVVTAINCRAGLVSKSNALSTSIHVSPADAPRQLRRPIRRAVRDLFVGLTSCV